MSPWGDVQQALLRLPDVKVLDPIGAMLNRRK